MAKVRVNSWYTFKAVGMDIWDGKTNLKDGDVVQVKNVSGCPKANVMGHCYVYKDDKFMGMVLCNSLTPLKKEGKVK